MTELSDNVELVKYSMAVLFIIPSITPLPEFVGKISESAIQVMETSQVLVLTSVASKCHCDSVLTNNCDSLGE